MNGLGIVKGLGVTLKRFIDTYLEDIRWLGKRYYTKEGVDNRKSAEYPRHLYGPVSRRKAARPGRVPISTFFTL